jgi:cytochrome c peroxidase
VTRATIGHLALGAAALAILVCAGVARGGAGAAPQASGPPLSGVAQLGRKMFFDRGLSASGEQACSSCHDPNHGFAAANDLAVQLGGPDFKTSGIRAVPSLAYTFMTPPFSIGPESPYEIDPQQANAAVPLSGGASGIAKSGGGAAMVPQGGFFWDGRADTLQEQTLGPLLSPYEMGNADVGIVYDKLRRAAYAEDFVRLFGANIFADRDRTIAEAAFALARYQIEERRFHAFTSKYDFYLRGGATLSPAERRGLALFDDPAKGNCAACHLDKPGRDGQPPVFTDYQFEALGVPRNRAIPANADPAWFDLGVCGPLRSDAYARQDANCGLFKTPGLRNVATRRAFFHNGVYHDLKDAVRFYVDRETAPAAVYPRGRDGAVARYDDLPAGYRGNIDRIDAPFDRKPGDPPALNPSEIDDVVAFLGTLTDGYQP